MLEVKNDKIRAENVELKVRIVKLEDKQLQNELIKIYYLYCEKRDPVLMLAGKSVCGLHTIDNVYECYIFFPTLCV
jgi:hypothetical protein